MTSSVRCSRPRLVLAAAPESKIQPACARDHERTCSRWSAAITGMGAGATNSSLAAARPSPRLGQRLRRPGPVISLTGSTRCSKVGRRRRHAGSRSQGAPRMEPNKNGRTRPRRACRAAQAAASRSGRGRSRCTISVDTRFKVLLEAIPRRPETGWARRGGATPTAKIRKWPGSPTSRGCAAALAAVDTPPRSRGEDARGRPRVREAITDRRAGFHEPAPPTSWNAAASSTDGAFAPAIATWCTDMSAGFERMIPATTVVRSVPDHQCAGTGGCLPNPISLGTPGIWRLVPPELLDQRWGRPQRLDHAAAINSHCPEGKGGIVQAWVVVAFHC